MSESKCKTHEHIRDVRGFMNDVITNLMTRAHVHDTSKLNSPEAEVFEEFTPKLRGLTYGSDEYKACLAAMKPALDHHYANNSHHPEHYKMWGCPLCKSVFPEYEVPESTCTVERYRFCPKCCPQGTMYEATLDPASGIRGMSLLDLLEMLCDWRAATMRHADGDIFKSIEINQKRFGYSDEIKQILLNTLAEMKEVNHGRIR